MSAISNINNNIFLIKSLFIFFKNCELFLFLKLILIIFLFFENFLNLSNYNTSIIHIMVLKFNSEYNLIIIALFNVLNFPAKIFLYKVLFNIIFITFLETINFKNELNFFKNDLFFDNINFSLTNGLLIMHPIFLYYICSSIITLFLNNMHFFKKLLIFNFFRKFNVKILFILSVSLFISIVLGSFWAEQELNWGGWWSWDLIEMVSVSYLVLVITYFHIPLKLKLYNLLFFNFFINFFIFTIIVKFNFINSVHNFTSLNSNFQFFFEVICLFIFLVLFIFLLKFFKKKNFFIKNNNNILSYTLFLVNVLIYIFIFIDFFFMFFGTYTLMDLFFKNYKLSIFVISIFFSINFDNKIIINFSPLIFWEFLLSYSIKYKTLNLDLIHVIFFLFIIFNNYIYFFFDLNYMGINNYSQFFITSSNFFNNCFLNYFTQSIYGFDLIFNNNIIFFKKMFFNNLLFTEFLISSEKLLLNLNFFFLIKFVFIMLVAVYINIKIKILFIF